MLCYNNRFLATALRHKTPPDFDTVDVRRLSEARPKSTSGLPQVKSQSTSNFLSRQKSVALDANTKLPPIQRTFSDTGQLASQSKVLKDISPEKRRSSKMILHPDNFIPEKALIHFSVPSTSREGAQYSPEELALRQRPGILSSALRNQSMSFPPPGASSPRDTRKSVYSSSPRKPRGTSHPPSTRKTKDHSTSPSPRDTKKRISSTSPRSSRVSPQEDSGTQPKKGAGVSSPGRSNGPSQNTSGSRLQKPVEHIADSSDEESRGGILGRMLGRPQARTLSREGTRKKKEMLQRRRSQGDMDSFDYGGGILGRALQRFSTRESLHTPKETPAVSRRPSRVPPRTPEINLVSGDGRTDTVVLLKKEKAGSSSEEEAEVEMEELFNLETLMKIDLSSKLLYFAKKKRWDEVEEVLKSNQRIDFSTADKKGLTPLFLAIKESKIPIVDKMIKMGADLYTTTKDRMTAMHIAAKYGNEEILKKLIDKKMDCNKPGGPDGKLPIHYAAGRKTPRALAFVQMLLRANPESRLTEDKRKNLPLHHAIQAGNVNVVQYLLNHDLDKQIHFANADGNRPLHLAAQKNFPMLFTIVDAGGDLDINEQNELGRTPLHEIAECGDEPMLKLMYKLRADANIMDKVSIILNLKWL